MHDDASNLASQAADSAQRIGVEDLAEQLFRKRKGRELTLDQASDQIGISAATLFRMERLRDPRNASKYPAGSFTPDTRTLVAVARWLGISLGQIVGFEASQVPATTQEEEESSVPDAVEAHLRADRNLDSESALALAKMFRVAYDQFSRIKQPRAGKASENPALKSHDEDGEDG